jgi:FtsP/CotA-like multicopper oxidase with cupredoxin domain
MPEDKLEHALEPSLVRILVELAVRFEKFSGRYMYHCHILAT